MKQRLELTWIGKEQRPRLEPRILLEDPELSYHAKERVKEEDIFDNRLIFGDNLLALKALEQEFAGQVKCIFVDPPYNTGSAFTHYDDGVEHSVWLTLLRDRLLILRALLRDDGVLWITLDDNEAHYFKVMADEVFGRANFVANVVWQKKPSVQANAVWFSDSHDHLLVYARDKSHWKPSLLPRTEEADARYSNPDNDPRGVWTSGPCTISLTSGQRGAQFARTGVSENLFEVRTPSGRVVVPPQGTCWRYSKDRFAELIADNRIYFGADGSNVPRYKRFLSEVQDGIVPSTLWLRQDAGDNLEAKREAVALNAETVFPTPKPERLLQRVLSVSTNAGDLVLDSFAGSGTTGAVAHKMGRRWIMVELGEHCHTHIVPRLRKVVDGEDPGGVTSTTGWKGGGGFRYYKLAPSLLKRDKYGQWVINDAYNAEMLAEAMCKHMGFTYAPSDELYWQHGQSTETDFIYVTTQTFNAEAMAHLSEEVGPNRTLLVCCTAWSGNPSSFPNLTFTKIPNAVLNKCEFGKDDYSLKVQNLPMRAPEPEPTPPAPRGRRADTATPDLFTATEEAGS